MSRVSRTVLREPRASRLRAALEALVEQTDAEHRLQHDPLFFVARQPAVADAEIAAVFASVLAYGRIAAFWPVIARVLELADARGGPRRWVLDFDAGSAEALQPLVYRWMRGTDLALLAAALGEALRRHGTLEPLFLPAPREHTVGPALDRAIRELRDCALAAAPRLGVPARSFQDLPRGFRTMLPRPSDGSACKRWNMLLRWMVRRPGPGAAGLDLGLWAVPPDRLVIPLDTHVLRLSWFLGLTRRTDGSWRTAEEITANLRRLSPDDPVRYDFALAHLGISGQCKGERIAPICDACQLVLVCRIGAAG